MSYIIQEGSLTIAIKGKVHTIDSTHPSFAKVKEAVFVGDFETAEKLINLRDAVSHYSEGKIVVNDDGVFFNGEAIHNVVCDRILEFFYQGEEFQPLVRFLERLMNNPSKNSVDQLYTFLEHRNIPITSDGLIVAYKSVRSDYLDFYSGKFDNTPGLEPISMPRNKVTDDPDQHCSNGFHVGALEYVRDFGHGDKRIVVCTIDPADVVSVPRDCNCMKMRVCKYSVIDDYTGPLPSTVYDPYDELNNDFEEWEIDEWNLDDEAEDDWIEDCK